MHTRLSFLQMKTIYCILFIFISGIASVIGQEPKVKFGSISPEDLAMKVYAPDTGAIAIILAKTGLVKYNDSHAVYPLSEKRYYAIKILKEHGINKYGNVIITYSTKDDYSSITDIKAMVHLPDGSTIDIDKSQIFEEKINDTRSSKKIAFPGLVIGSVIEYQYTLNSKGMFHPVDWFFQSSIPIVYTELKTILPEDYDYAILTQGGPLDLKQINTKSQSIKSAGSSSGTSSEKNITNVYINEDVPALKEESFVTTLEDYFTRVRYQLRSVQHPGTPRKQILNTWAKLSEELYALPEWGGQLKNKRPGELVLNAANISPEKDTSQMETAQKIYDYINQNIQWNGKYNFSTSQYISDILKARSGSSGDLTKLMCAALLRCAIVANPVLLSTRDHGKTLELYPFADQFNHMVVLATIDKKECWIDPGDKNLPIGTLRPEALNSRGWIADEEDPRWTDINPVKSNSTYLINGSLDQDGNIKGDIETRFTGYDAYEKRKKIELDKELPNHLLVSGAVPLKISDAELINVDTPSMLLEIKGKINDQSIATVTSDKIYLNPVFPTGLDEIPFRLESRTYPIEMNYPSEVSLILNLSLPEGYTLESLPAPMKISNSTGGIKVTYDVGLTSGKLNIAIKYLVRQTLFEPEEYSTLKTIFMMRSQKLNEQIVLTKS